MPRAFFKEALPRAFFEKALLSAFFEKALLIAFFEKALLSAFFEKALPKAFFEKALPDRAGHGLFMIILRFALHLLKFPLAEEATVSKASLCMSLKLDILGF